MDLFDLASGTGDAPDVRHGWFACKTTCLTSCVPADAWKQDRRQQAVLSSAEPGRGSASPDVYSVAEEEAFTLDNHADCLGVYGNKLATEFAVLPQEPIQPSRAVGSSAL